MKLAPLLAQYLYSNKRLDLPGIGSFILDPSVSTVTDAKQGKLIHPEGISFENDAAIRDAPDLINYISSQTGKIKALAAADLDSHLELAKQFLNMGKPFLFEGIGHLARIRSGQFTFTAGDLLPESQKESSVRELSTASPTEESLADYKSIFYPRKEKLNWRKPAALLLLLSGVGLAIWGGYRMYKKTTAKNDETPVVEKKEELINTVPVPDTVRYQKDSVVEQPPAAVAAGNYKFVLEVSPAKRAFDRFSRLKTFQWDVKMETKDSLSYKIFMLLPATAAETNKIADSLSLLNGRKVFVEQ
ncbi:MAG: hypothetical protein ABIT05_15445 [Chitinophagaceae bacterium]